MFGSRPRFEDLFRTNVRKRFRADRERERDEKLESGRYPFEGGWRTLDEIKAMRREMVARDRRIFFELLAVYTVIAGLIGFLVVLLVFVLPW